MLDSILYVLAKVITVITTICFIALLIDRYGPRGGAVGRGTELQAGRSRVRFTMVSLEIFIDIILPAALWPWG